MSLIFLNCYTAGEIVASHIKYGNMLDEYIEEWLTNCIYSCYGEALIGLYDNLDTPLNILEDCIDEVEQRKEKGDFRNANNLDLFIQFVKKSLN